MRKRSVACFVVSALLVAVPSLAVDLTGSWGGQYQLSDRCDNGNMIPYNGSAGALLNQNGNRVTGSLALVAVADTDTTACKIDGTFDVTLDIDATLSGSTLSGTFVVLGGEPFPFTADVTTDSIVFHLVVDFTTGTITLNRTSGGLSGSYSGTYNAAISPCCKQALVPYSGGISGTFVQVGSALNGTFTATNLKGDHENADGSCSLVDVPSESASVNLRINGNTVTGTEQGPGDDQPNPISGTINGTTLTFHIAGECNGEFIDATISKSASGPPPPTAPIISSFTATPSSITPGQSSRLSWATVNATSVSIDNGVGTQPAGGAVDVRPTSTTTYTLTATGSGGTATASTTVTVSTNPARVVVTAFPHGMVQAAGQGGAIDSFALTNLGGTATTVTLSQSANFFTISPSSFNLPPSATVVVAAGGVAQTAGFFEGSVTGAGISVPIRLLSAAPPSGTVNAAPAVSRADVPAQPGQNPTSSVNFTNSGSGVLQGIAVSDVPWMTPQAGIITIAPGETQPISFTIDSSKRPDSSSPIGGVTGKISLVFISGAPSSKQALATAPTTSVSVTIVYVVAPGVAAGSPPPLGAGEFALFVPGIQNRPKAVGDVLIATRDTLATTSDLKFFFQGPGAASQVATLPQIPLGGAATFPGLLKNIFNSAASSGTLQVRGADISKVSVAAVQSNNSASNGTFGTALPVFRSDRGVGAGGQIVLSGVDKEPGIQTDLYIQELSGNAATAQVDFLGADGSVISSRPQDSLAGFGMLELIDAVPASAAAVRIRNTSTGVGKINAYGLVINPASGDRWAVTDPAASALSSDDTFIIPLTNVVGGSALFFATNRSATPTSFSLDMRSGSRRRVVSGRDLGSVIIPTGVQTYNLRPFETVGGFAPGTGYMRLSTAGAVSAGARTVASLPGSGAFGSGLPAVPLSSAIVNGDTPGSLKRFAGVEDGTAFGTSLMLIEATNQPATVRVRLRYTFVAGSTVSATGESFKDYSVAPAQALSILNLAREVIGNARDAFGDLHNMTLSVEMTEGPGRIIPFLLVTDKTSGDMVVRTE